MANTRQHSRNLFAICGSSFFFMSSYYTTIALQTSLNTEHDLGLVCLATLYAFYGFSCFISPAIVKLLNTKWTIFLASVIHCGFVGVNIYPRDYTLIPAAALVGLFAGSLWSAQASHLTTTALNLALNAKENVSRIIGRYNGIFYLFFIACLIPGNMIASIILHDGGMLGPIGAAPPRSLQCGATGCWYLEDTYGSRDLNLTDGSTDNITFFLTDEPTTETRVRLFAVLTSWGVLGCVIAMLLLDPLHSFCKIIPQTKNLSEHIGGIFKIMGRGKFVLLIPLIAFTSLEVGFIYATFTKSFVGCYAGVKNIGFAMSVYGFGGFVAAVVSGGVVKYTGRLPLLTAAFLSQVSVYVLMVMWVPYTGLEWQVYAMVVMCGVGGSIRLTQICGFLGVLFPRDQESAFTAFNILYAFSYSLYFGLEMIKQICVIYLIYGLISWLTLSMLFYYIVEWRIRHVGFLSINDETFYEDNWQEIEKENRTKLLHPDGHHQFNNSGNSSFMNRNESGKQTPVVKLFIEDVETVV